ncbi:CPBP family intramembrane glutamic endopeptidase [Nesterenkonia lutea]|uniref:Membrane protease YdiL (CAAX protease family) n=1 Tax=Nesterenkonia lutea TaxID=272919 RepID=A0ABR9JIN0_9MICC|nr:type II CAAX endopeptidase family protein [Nesterenkonia lutea]MBE1525387.1 membrane protease YdiL (CAAX protease family) [Nesterenkonia lutea]
MTTTTFAVDRSATATSRVDPLRGLSGFFAITFAVSWLIWWLGPLAAPGSSATMPLVIAGSFGPAIAAVVVTACLEGRAGIKSLFGRYLPKRQGGIRPFLLGLVVFGVLLASGGVALLAGASLEVEGLRAGLIALPGSIILIALVGGGNEELGWRGFALPRLQAVMPPVIANIMLGVIWAVWHAPLWSMATSQSEMSFPISVLMVVAISIVLGFIFNVAGGGLLAVVAAHTAVNAAGGLKAAALGGINEIHELFAIALIAVALLISTRGWLGLPHHRATRSVWNLQLVSWMVLVILGSAGAWFAWMGWDQSYWTDPVTELQHGPYRAWQVVGCTLTLVVIAVSASRGRHWPTVLLLPPAFTLAWVGTTVSQDTTGLWMIGALLVLCGSAAATLLVLALVRGIPAMLTRRRRAA